MYCCASHVLLCFTSTAVCLFRFDLVEIKHMQNKNENKVVWFHAGFKNHANNAKLPKTYTYKSRKRSPTCPPLKLCAVRRQENLLNLSCTNSLGTSCLSSFLGDSCSATCSSHSCQDCLSKFLSVGSCLDPVHVHHTCMLHAIARSKTFRQNITKP